MELEGERKAGTTTTTVSVDGSVWKHCHKTQIVHTNQHTASHDTERELHLISTNIFKHSKTWQILRGVDLHPVK